MTYAEIDDWVEPKTELCGGIVVRGKGVPLDEITAALGLQPTRVRSNVKAWPHIPSRTGEISIWTWQAPLIRTMKLEPEIQKVLERIEPRATDLLQLGQRGMQASVCGIVYARGTFPEMTLSPETISRLAELRVTLDLDCYFEDDKDITYQGRQNE